GVDAVVIGSVTDYSPYYPPRCGLRVEWYAANSGFHEIPPGYGLPWGTPKEEFIPAPLVFESEFALAKAQLATQTPACEKPSLKPPVLAGPKSQPSALPGNSSETSAPNKSGKETGNENIPSNSGKSSSSSPDKNSAREKARGTIHALYEEPANGEELPERASTASSPPAPVESDSSAAAVMTASTGAHGALPENWPDERG